MTASPGLRRDNVEVLLFDDIHLLPATPFTQIKRLAAQKK